MSRFLGAAFLALATVFSLPAAAQEAAAPSQRLEITQYKVDGWQTEHGLPQTTVQAMHQSRDGYLWIGTGGGLARFDGVRFATFESTPVGELASRPVYGFMEDRDGWLWIGHTRGASRYRDGVFERVIPNELTEGRRVWSFVQDRDGAVWAASENGLLRWENGRTRLYTEADGLPLRRLRTLVFDRDGTLWIGTSGGGLVAMRGGRFETLSPKNGGFPHFEVRHLLADDTGLWAATAGGGLVRMEGGRIVRSITTREGLPTDQLTFLARDKRGALWIGTWGAGLARLQDGRVSTVASAGGLGGDQVWSVHVDREGSIWTGTWNGGLNRLSERAFTVFGKPEGISADNVRTVLHARDGSTWIATAGGGVNRLFDGAITHFRQKDGLASDEASSVIEDRDGAIWVATYTAGISRIRLGRPIESFGLRQGLPNLDVRVLYLDASGTIWAGTSMGLARFDGRRFVAVRDPGAPTEGIVSLLQDRAGTLWIGTSGDGLYRLRDGKFDVLTRKQGLASNWIIALHEDPAGTLWVGTNGEGINRIKDGNITRIRVDDGLWDGIVQTLIPDGTGHFWITCNRGFYRVRRDELDAFAEGRVTKVTSRAFGPGDALRSTTFAGNVQPAGAADALGRLWLPSLKGLVIVDPGRLPGRGEPPPVLLEEVAVDGRSALAREPLVLAPGRHTLSIRYTAGTLLNADRVRFRHRMEGVSEEWVDAGRAREAAFPALPHGRYVFRVAASIDGQRWNEASAPLVVTVQPHFWQTRWFVAALVLGTLTLAWLLFRLRTRQIMRRSAEMERLVAAKTEELRIANEHLSRLSFADPLTGLANRRRLDEALDTEWRRGLRTGVPLAVVVADIDAFKAYNDTLGHSEGDKCLVQIADVIRQVTSRAGDFAARYGGEEFVVVIPGADEAAARIYAEGLRLAIETRGIPHPASRVAPVVTVSVGYASRIPTAEASAAILFNEADAALYRAKQEGGNRAR